MKTIHYSIIAILLIVLLSETQIHVYADNTTSSMVSPFNHTLAFKKQLHQYYLNDTQKDLGIKLAENSTQFQSLVKGYNYTFIGGSTGSRTQSTGGMEITEYVFAFALYSGPVNPSYAVKVVEVVVDPSITTVLKIVSDPAKYNGPAMIHITVPEFPFAVPIMLIGIVSVIAIYRIKFRK